MGTLMDTTSKRLASAIRDVKSSGAPAQAASPGGKYHGGFQSGGGTWGRAVTGRGEPAGASQLPAKKDSDRKPLATSHPLQPQTSAQNIMRPGSSVGRRQRIRPNSAGAFSTWDTIGPKDLPKCAKGTSPRPSMRPRSATARPAAYRCRLTCHQLTQLSTPILSNESSSTRHTSIPSVNASAALIEPLSTSIACAVAT